MSCHEKIDAGARRASRSYTRKQQETKIRRSRAAPSARGLRAFVPELATRQFVPSGEAGPIYTYNPASNDMARRVLTVCCVKRSELLTVDSARAERPAMTMTRPEAQGL